MKYLFSVLVIFMGIHFASAQSCSSYYFFKEGQVIEMTSLNKRGKTEGISTYTVKDLKKGGDGAMTATIAMQMNNEKGKELVTAQTVIRCLDGNYQMDMSQFIPSAQMEQFKDVDASGSFFLEYPSNMKTGDVLKDGKMEIQSSTNGMKMDLEMDITDRKVEAKESVTTPAGTWECFKITNQQKMRMKMAGIGIPVKTETTEWYAPGFGMVKTQSKYGISQITSIK
jgi:hypothetical protein